MRFLATVLLMTVFAGGAAAIPVAFDLGKAANKDVVYEGGGGGTAQPFGGNANATHAFGEAGFVDGFPANRRVQSSDPDLGFYLLLPYDAPNVIELCSLASVPAESHAIDVPNQRYSKIGMLVSAVDGDVSFTITLRYDDGSIDTLWWEADDWYDLGPRGNLQKALRDMDRVNAASGLGEDSNHFNLYEFIIDAKKGLKTDKKLQAIVVGSEPNRWPDDQLRYGGIFAINGVAEEPRAE